MHAVLVAYLLFLVQPLRFLIYDITVDVDNAKAPIVITVLSYFLLCF